MVAKNSKRAGGRPGVGIGVDAFGDAVDPSENVKDLSEAANKRQDDLRKANNKLMKSEIKRIDAKIKCANEMAELRDQHAKELRAAETSRLDSIRQVDVAAGRTEADRALAAIQTLAATTTTNAENIRTTLNATAVTIAKSTSDTVQQITERIAALEKSSYEGVGKQRMADPQMAELVAEMKALRGTKSEGIDKTWGIIVVVATLLLGIVGTYLAMGRATPAAPQIVYLPAASMPPTTVQPPR